ncbi:hypothetical protein JRO89_XS04G0138000 [Xanthoceras sorbifolium]|uniref:Uncharacterized protein n=1 Tax=Xanthoceras sorbifolium TaxID=99658 RepID=A0ABQ8I562_9ROSI|nr:hypothetical protein JRO89_XS04G0138000 [Xanthoceras sorbifolium]
MGGIAWSEEEDQLLKKCIAQYGEGKWHRIPLLSGIYLHQLQITTKVEVLRPQPRHCNVATPMPVPPPLRLEEVPTQPSQEESSLSTPSILQHPEFKQSQNVESNEKPGNIEDVNFGELLVDFDLEQVILTDYQTSSNWEWNDDLMILDMDIWTHSF